MTLEIHPIQRGNLTSEVEYFLRIDGNTSIPQRLAATVAQNPDSIALRSPEMEISFQEFDGLTNRVAHVLLDGFKGDKGTVGLLFGHSPLSLIGMFGTLKTGKICVPMDPDYPFSHLAYMVKDSGLQVILTETKNLELAERLKPDGCEGRRHPNDR